MARHPLAMGFAACVVFAGCQPGAAPVKLAAVTEVKGSIYPARSLVAPPAFKVFHRDNDTYTLVTRADATDSEIAGILWQLRDAARVHRFDALRLSQSFIDARKPSVWFHVYRGAKCAGEKFTKGKLPCEAAYHGAGDFTLGAYGNSEWNDGVLRHEDGTETHLWNADLADAGK